MRRRLLFQFWAALTSITWERPRNFVVPGALSLSEASQLMNLCECGGPLLVEYDLSAIRKSLVAGFARFGKTPSSMWRYAPVLPLDEAASHFPTEGWTPLSHARKLGNTMGATGLFVKDEGRNPTLTFKARGLCCAVSMAKKLGAKKLAIPSAGNAAGALGGLRCRCRSRSSHLYAKRRASIQLPRKHGVRRKGHSR